MMLKMFFVIHAVLDSRLLSSLSVVSDGREEADS